MIQVLVRFQVGMGFVHLGMGFVHLGMGFVHLGMGFVHLGMGFVHLRMGFVHLGGYLFVWGSEVKPPTEPPSFLVLV